MADSRENSLLEGVDRAALMLAVVAGAVTVVGTEGSWTIFNAFIGVLLVAMVAGFHRAVPPGGTLRHILMRMAFGFALSLALLIFSAWFIQAGTDNPAAPLGAPSVLIFTGLAVVLALAEPNISRLLDRR